MQTQSDDATSQLLRITVYTVLLICMRSGDSIYHILLYVSQNMLK